MHDIDLMAGDVEVEQNMLMDEEEEESDGKCWRCDSVACDSAAL